MMQLPPQNVRVEHWLFGQPEPLTMGKMMNLRLSTITLECRNGYQVLKYVYVPIPA